MGIPYFHTFRIAASGLAVPGYFVLGGNVTGNIGAGGLGGADATCEVTLRDTDWLGKDDVAGCTSSSCPIAHAFLCDSLTCNNLQPNATYKFANATGSGSTNGGAEFTTDASGRGPNDAKNWSDNDAFGTSAVWWANRFVSNSSFWETTPSATNPNSVCSDWTTSVNFRTGLYGDVNNVDGQRWNESLVSCNNARRLICYINP